MSKSAIYVANTTTQAIASGGTVDFGSVIRRFGCNLDATGNRINVIGSGYYDTHVSITGTGTTAGTITATLNKNGTAIVGATASATITADDLFNLDFSALIREFCCESASTLTLTLTGTASVNVTNSAVVVEKL